MKRNVTSKSILISMLCIFCTGLSAQQNEEELKLQLQIRPRAELRNGVFTPILEGQKAASFISQRNRLGLIYNRANKISTGLTMQMLNVWGNDPQVQQTANNISLFEAWAQIALATSSRIKIGRQVFSYDDERILGALDWHNAGRKHDAALFMYEKAKLKAHIALAFNQNSEKVTNNFFNDSLSQPYKNLQFVWLQYKLTDSLSFSALLMNQTKQRNSDSLLSYLQTFGVNAFYKTGKLSTTASFYYQSGNADYKNASAVKTSAWMASIYGDHKMSKKTAINFGTDYLSGMEMGSTGRSTAFNPLYGTHHKFYGYMDYFYVASPHKNTGLWDSYLGTTYKADKKTALQLSVHHFVSPVKILDNQNTKASSYLGNEIDLSFSHNICKGVNIIGGYAHMLPSTSMKFIKNISDKQLMKSVQNWAWLSLVVNPDINIFNRVIQNNQ